MLYKIQGYLWCRNHLLSITHRRAQPGLSGPLTKGNDSTDSLSRVFFLCFCHQRKNIRCYILMLFACTLLIRYYSLKIVILSNAVLSMFPSCVDLFPLVQIHGVYAQIRFGKWLSLTFLYSLLYVPTCYHRHLFFTGFFVGSTSDFLHAQAHTNHHCSNGVPCGSENRLWSSK